SLALLVGALAEVVEAKVPVLADEIQRRPVPVFERPPDGEGVVDDDRVADAQLAGRTPHVVEIVLEPELGRVNADGDEPAVAIPLVPRAQVGQGPQPVDARVRPEVDKDDAAAQLLGGKGLGVEPDGRAVQPREGAAHYAGAASWSALGRAS